MEVFLILASVTAFNDLIVRGPEVGNSKILGISFAGPSLTVHGWAPCHYSK